MLKIKILISCFFVLCLLVITLTFLRIKNHDDFRQKVLLAGQIHKALGFLMLDIYQARKGSFKDLPADGMWHDRISFIQKGHGALAYLIKGGQLLRLNGGRILLIADHIADFHIRRRQETPDILEVQFLAQSNVSLVSNFKIKVH